MNISHLASASHGPLFRAFTSHSSGPLVIERHETGLVVSNREGGQTILSLSGQAPVMLAATHHAISNDEMGFKTACAALEFLFSTEPDIASVCLAGEGWADIIPSLVQRGLCVPDPTSSTQFLVLADMFWQIPDFWNATVSPAYPRHDIFDGKTFHPVRPPKPTGRLYTRFIPWLEGVLSFDAATHDDLPHLHRWMNNPRIDEFWHEAGDQARHTAYLDIMLNDPHVLPVIGRFNNQPFSYFEVYWAKEDLIGTYCNAGDYDRGCHVIIGEEEYRGKAWFTAWLPSLLHYMFLDDARTQRIVQEPQANHYRQLKNLHRSGFSHIGTVDFPGKRAALLSITRQHFFSSRLWHPQPARS
ncbi:RimJ/RimL family protein N-acetyltransferase [Agrobacterium vitis]|nr:RimJ/RimL family protein N-acetyltransferase [Agrobacterium vitis]MBE1436389.1 RimJ/RimL family protein N-acetyltransferase [Agrobacterium vitis]